MILNYDFDLSGLYEDLSVSDSYLGFDISGHNVSFPFLNEVIDSIILQFDLIDFSISIRTNHDSSSFIEKIDS